MKTRKRIQITGSKGFTLVELMVAMLLFGIGLSAIATVLPNGMETRGRAERLSIANALAQQEIERIRDLPFNDADLDAGTHDDPTNPVEGAYQRSWVIIDNSPIAEMKKVEVTVTFNTSSPDSSVTLTTYVTR